VLVLEETEDPRSPSKRAPFGMLGLSVPTIEAFHRRGLLSGIAAISRGRLVGRSVLGQYGGRSAVPRRNQSRLSGSVRRDGSALRYLTACLGNPFGVCPDIPTVFLLGPRRLQSSWRHFTTVNSNELECS
jgi:hypothetical protein